MNNEQKTLFNERIGTYVREDGSILGKPRKGRPDPNWKFGHVNRYGYMVVYHNGKVYQVHRLLAETFIPNPENKPTVDHINRDTLDNRLDNLRWATRKEQQENRVVPMGRLGIRAKDRSAYNRALYQEYKSKGGCC